MATQPDCVDDTNVRVTGGSVLITGTYSSRNKGDFAMQQVMAQELIRRGHFVTASVPFPDDDRSSYSELNVPLVPSSRRKLVTATWLLLRLAVWSLLRRPGGWIKKLLLPDREVGWFDDVDLVVDLSGDMITEDYGPHVAYSHLLPLAMAALLQKPYVLIGQSIGPFHLMLVPARWVLRHALLITVRDTISRDYLVSLGLQEPALTADLAFLLPADHAASFVASSKNALPEEEFVGVSISSLIASRYEKNAPGSSREAFLSEMARGLDEFASTNGLRVILIPHVTGPKRGKDDRLISRELASRITSDVVCLDDDLSPAALKGMIGRASIFVGARMHANIAALSSCVPTVAIAYSHKTHGIMDMHGLADFVIDIGSLSAEVLRERLTAALLERDEIGNKLRERHDAIRRAAEQNIELVDEHLAFDRRST